MKFHSTCLLAMGTLLPVAFAEDKPKQAWPETKSGHYVIEDFKFDSGGKLDELELHYQTLGKLKVHSDGSTNAVFIMHGTTGLSEQFLNDDFAKVLFNPGQVLDAEDYFIILRDGIGHGNSSRPSNTDLRADFPSYQYSDMVRADHQLLTEHFGINHTRLHMGVSMGGMHTWMWGELYPDFMDALMPIASFPVQISGHNRLWRKFVLELITRDPAWNGGDYKDEFLTGLAGALLIQQVMLSSPTYWQREYPSRDAIDSYVEELMPHIVDYDANDQLYAWNASHTYDPEADLGLIKAPLVAVNTADDWMNPAELGILERTVNTLMKPGLGKAVTVPASKKTSGHDSYIKAELWKDELQLLLAKTRAKRNAGCLA
ncbi:homoserine O-acetyltransferase [Fusarium albosuccineum]|uniref:Homoserine O-acetyltransferase n=1 Tax=Fusarium albosuccineum TaxID=1237068 RepID=A0A8H4P8A1_9HYPO|nr:homoserine O-acetyltransferase [Fusarium albosuccineum]